MFEFFIWLCVTTWNALMGLFGGIASTSRKREWWEEQDNGSVIDASPMEQVLENPTNEFAWAGGIVGTLAATAGRAVGKAIHKEEEKGIPDELMNI